ncbi:non-ribosomal peptide synthetase [Chitinophaga flava]|uniref:Uncharacterized protein n=1 Tax=Chitinophaga flava TaxID=2259036 RepID=A0A365XV05_9BACT|nr:non-ribosomal peptide synthetase [Chitinophaga flava]RBL89851.1 hypothetical protein DF182_25555 [Chitinophaga flava]
MKFIKRNRKITEINNISVLKAAKPEIAVYQDNGQAELILKEICSKGVLQLLLDLGLESRQVGIQRPEDLRKVLGIEDRYDRLFTVLVDLLEEMRYLKVTANGIVVPDVVKQELIHFRLKDALEQLAAKSKAYQPHIQLINICLSAFTEILTGRIRATDVIFPGGSLDNVSGIYKGNYKSDYFNELLAGIVKDSVEEGLKYLKQGEKIRILEVGAGTGGTSELIFRKLAPYKEHITYVYTDMSRSFLFYAEETYKGIAPYLETALFNIEKSPAVQNFEAGSCDIVIGANVVHATKDIAATLTNIKGVLKKDGLLILNEIAGTEMFTTLTFGLLDGWWLYEDAGLRLPGSPGLSAEGWHAVLTETGFEQAISYPEKNDLSQQIVVAKSNGSIIVGNDMPQASPEVVVVQEHSSDKPLLNDVLSAAELHLKSVFSRILKLDVSRIDTEARFEMLGIDSILIGTLARELSVDFGTVPVTTFFEYRNISELAAYFAAEHAAFFTPVEKVIIAPDVEAEKTQQDLPLYHTPVTQQSENKNNTTCVPDDAIAIVGLSGRYPGAANIREFWENLKSGTDSITEIPKDRWDIDRYFDERKGKEGKINTRYGGFINGVAEFDPLFFNISPKEAEHIDPQERLFLQTVWEAIEDAGYAASDLSQRAKQHGPVRTGVYVGVMYGEYQLFGPALSTPLNPVAVGASASSIANRISYYCDFDGPSMAVDTMCSSSLTAIHLACRDLQSGEADVAIAGGVNVSIHPNKYLLLSHATFLSSRGRCESFGSEGEGFIPSEGVGAIVLKKLSKAEADGDHIYGVIKATAVNHGGRANGYTVPNPVSQAAVIRDAMNKAGVKASDFSYIEAHGTGTSLGDPVEIAGLTKAFQSDRKQYCSIGAVKSNIGHCESAAGISGVTKVLLQLQHRQLVPSLHSAVLNTNINFENTPFKVQQTLETWITENNQPRLAGVSGFGAGGSNAHIIIEEYRPGIKAAYNSQDPAMIVLSAKNESRLKEQVINLKGFLENNTAINIYDVAYTLQVGREAMEERLALIVDDRETLIAQLDSYLTGKNKELFTGNIKKEKQDFLINGEAGKSYIQKAIEAKELVALAQLWIKGTRFDWSLFYGKNKPARISLPTYPFARQRYWIPEVDAQQVVFNHGNILHPLLHSNESDLSEQKYASLYTGTEPFFTSYKKGKEKLLPGVAFLELAREAGERSIRQKITQLKNIAWEHPVGVNGTSKKVYTSVYPSGKEIGYEVYTQNEADIQVHCQGILHAQALTAPAKHTLSAIRDNLHNSRTGAECYHLFDGLGLNYSSAFQGIEMLYYSDTTALSKIAIPTETGYVLHPGVLDSALQTCAAMNLTPVAQKQIYPVSLREINIYRELPAAVWCYVRKRKGGAEEAAISYYDVDLMNDGGEVLLTMTEFALSGVPASAMATSSASPDSLVFLTPGWALSAGPSVLTAKAARQVLVLAGDNVASKVVSLSTAGITVKTFSGSCPMQYSSFLYEVIKEVMADGNPARITVLYENKDAVLYDFATGLFKTFQLGNHQLSGQVLGIDTLDMPADALLNMLAFEAQTRDIAVRYINKQREINVLKTAPASPSSAISLKEGGVYLITGGTGGLGKIFASYLSQQGKNIRLILTGRSVATADKQSFVSGIPGAVYYTCNISDQEEVTALINNVRKEYGAVNGIIHSAGVSPSFEGTVLEKDITSSAVILPKIAGTRYLDEATKNEPLDFVVYFSSVSGTLDGVMGFNQSDYALANAYLNSYAHKRSLEVAAGMKKGQTISINWPVWESSGMYNEDSDNWMENVWGIKSLPVEEGIAAFEKIMHLQLGQVMVLYGQHNRLVQSFAVANKEKATTDTTDLQLSATKKMLEIAAQLLKLTIADIEPDAELGDYGFDSVSLTKFSNELNDYYDLDLKPTVFYNYPTVEGLAIFLAEEYADNLAKKHAVVSGQGQVAMVAAPVMQRQPILKRKSRFLQGLQSDAGKSSGAAAVAIVGMSGRFPGSPDLATFWNNIRDNKDLIVEIPSERWDWKKYDGDPQKDMNKTRARWGGFINDVDKFDPLFFNISPREAELMDPQQRITLEAVYHALEDAGINVKDLSGSNTGIFIGAYFDDYASLVQRSNSIQEAQSATGISHSILTNRISYLFNLHGPSEPVDTACSSSLVAVHRAVEHIRNGDCDIVITGGVSLDLIPETLLPLSQAGMLSEDGRCKTFDQAANGYVRGEGVGIVILKSLSKAEADGDHIYGIIRGTAENHGGKANTLTSPNPSAQKDLLLKAYRSANINPGTVSYIEAHGTGTPLGDPIETEGLKLAFRELYKEWNIPQPETPHCSIGSVKTNIGHLEAAAGMAGMMKVLLSLQHHTLPGNPHLNTPNTYLKLEDSPFRLQKGTEAWVSVNNQPRIAGISSFGFGGVNAHVIIEEYPQKNKIAYTSTTPAIIVLSARNEHRLKEQVINLKRYLEVNKAANLYDIAYTLQTGREPMEERLALTVDHITALTDKLTGYLQGEKKDVLTNNIRKNTSDFSLKGGAGQAYINYAIENKESASLAQLWVKGVDVDWALLYGNDKPAKISLPVYPFARQRYWVPEIKTQIVLADNHSLSPAPAVIESDPTTDEQVPDSLVFLTPGWVLSAGPSVLTAKATRQVLVLAGKDVASTAGLLSAAGITVKTCSGSGPMQYSSFLYEVIKEVMADSSPARITILHENKDAALYGFATGVFKTFQLGSHQLSGQVLGIDTLAMPADALLNMLAFEAQTRDIAVRYVNNQREINVLKTAAASPASTITLKEGGVYLITGGTGGLGKIFASYLSQQGKNIRLILTGRSAATADKQSFVSGIPGAVYYACNINDQEEVNTLINHIRKEYGAVHGIIHAAGVAPSFEGTVLEKDIASSSVILPKIMGTRYLDEATKEEPLDFVVYFSSVSGTLDGVMGFNQSDYALANAYLNNYAHKRNEEVAAGSKKGQTISIGWPVWEQGGMYHEDSDRWMENVWGIKSLPVKEGIAAFEKALHLQLSQVTILYGQHNRLVKSFAVATKEKSTTDTAELQLAATRKILEIAAQLLKLSITDIEPDTALGDYGFDSILMTRFSNDLNSYYDLDLKPTVFYNYPTVEGLAIFLTEEYADSLVKKHPGVIRSQQTGGVAVSNVLPSQITRQQTTARQDKIAYNAAGPVAIIGMSGRFPGSPDLATFWNNIRDNKDLVIEIPAERWDWRKYDGDPQKDKNKTRAKWGGFINDADKFDPLFFGISPKEAELMDPQQRITLEAVYHALEDACINVKDLSGSNTGVFIGAYFNDYASLIQHNHVVHDAQLATGISHSILTNRISYLFNLHGPSEPVDTACSSSLVAMHRAVEHVRNGDCDIVITGGVSLDLIPEPLLPLSQAGMLSEDGRCKTFDQTANGYVRGEGVGIVILKSLSKAEADGDHIYGIIRGTAENHGGKANTLTSPNPAAQKDLLLKAYRSANINPGAVSYIEAHGTGTPLGDPIETEGLKLAFKELYKERNIPRPEIPHCGIGSVKTNVGHLEAAAGMASVMKVLLSLQHRILPGNPHLKTPNAYLKLEDSPFYLQKETAEWKSINNQPRIAGISSFGFGGANAHIIIEEYQQATKVAYSSQEPAIIVLSARNEHRLKEQVANLKCYIGTNPAASLYDIAYSLQTGREAMEERLALIAENKEALEALLTDYLTGITTNSLTHVFSGSTKKDKSDLLLKGGAGHAYINYAIANKELAAIAQLWVKGVDIDWSLLYGHQKPAKISLPAYPFARDRYWFDSYKTTAKPVVNTTPQDKPLEQVPAKTFAYEDLFNSHTTGDEIKIRFLKEGIAIVSMEAIATSNMLNIQLMISLKKTLDELRKNNALKVLVLTGYQKVFSMGGDQQGLESIAQSESSVTYFPFLYKGLLEFNVPVISAIQGHAFGGGLILGMYGDIVLLSENSTYSANFMKYGFTPGMGSTYILGEKLGKQLATEMMYTARLVSGEEIKRRGASVIVTGDVMKEALQIARELSEKPKNALEALKKKLSADILNVLDYHVAEEQKMHDLTFHTKEVEALISSHFAKTAVQTATPTDKRTQEIPAQSSAKVSLSALDTITLPAKEEQLSPVAAPTARSANRPAIIKVLKEIFEEVLHVPVAELVEDATFIDLGLDSISGVEILQKINNTFGIALQGPMLYDNPTLQQLAAKISEESGWLSDQLQTAAPVHTDTKVSLTAVEKVVLQPVAENMLYTTATVTTHEHIPQNAPAKRENAVAMPVRQEPDIAGIIKTLKEIFEDVLHVPVAELVEDATFIDLGLDSISGVEILQKINNAFGIALQGPTLYDNPTLQQLAGKVSEAAGWLSDQVEATAATPFAAVVSGQEQDIAVPPPALTVSAETAGVNYTPANESATREDMAVVGMDGLFPGSDNPEELWAQVLLNKRIALPAGGNTVEWHSIDAATVEAYAAAYAQSTRGSSLMSRQYQLVFGVLGRLLDTAGITRKALSGSRTGVFIAISQVNSTDSTNREYSSENVAAMLPAKISYEYNLTGPCEVINAACTSSYLTLHKAMQSIRMGECDQAIVGGINVISRETANYEGLADLGKLLSRDGEMKSFEDDADGIVRSEGVGIIIIKRLAAAKADKNNIYALIKGTCFAHGGKNLSWEAPNPKGIKEVVRRSLEYAGVNPATIDYVEAHGIANRMADAVELGAINDVYRELCTDATKKWYISSIKPVVGHAELASGMASLIKAIKALQHKTIPGIPGFANINSELAPGHSMLLQSGAIPWENGRYPRRAALNSYAVGGVNAHVILEEYKGAATPEKSRIAVSETTEDTSKGMSAVDTDIVFNTQLSAFTREIFEIDMAEIDRTLSPVDYDFDSVKVIRFIREINDVFGLDIKMGQVLGADNFGVLFDLLKHEWKKKETQAGHGNAANTLVWMEKKYPLSEGQKGLWFIQHLEPGNTTYNLPLALILEGEVDTEQIQKALMSVLEDHPVLRSNFIREAVTGEICHKINTPAAAVFVDHSILGKNEDVKETFWQLLRKPFNLESDCLLRLYLKRDPDAKRTYLLFVTHHIVFDGTSSALFMASLFEKYKQLLKRENKTDKQPDLAYFNFVAWEQEYIGSSRGEAALSYWREKLSGNLPLLSLPYDITSKETNTAGVGCGIIHLKKQELDALKLLARKLNVNLSVLFLSVFNLLLNRLTGEEDILILTPVAGRPGKEYERSIGYYVNMMVTRNNVSPGKLFQQLAKETKQEFLNGIDYAAYPFPRLVSALNLHKGNGREAAFNVAYSYQNIFDNVLESGDFGAVTALDGLYQETAFDYSLEINDLREELIVNLKYNKGLFYTATIERHLTYFKELLKGIAENPAKALKDYNILPEEEYHELVVTRNNTAIDYPRNKTLINLFEEQVAKTPDQIALVFKGERITYKALHEKVCRLANHLKKARLPLNAPVSIVSHKSPEQIWGILGILKAGGHYVPVKGNLPSARINELILETASPIVLVQQDYMDKVNVPTAINVVLLEEHVFAAKSSLHETVRSSDTDLAYIIFTSGSTGKPKGVMIDHRGAVNTLYDMNARFGIGASDKVFGISDLNFDLSVYDVFGTFACGATLILPSEEERQHPEVWLRYVKEERVTVWNSVPQIVNLLIDFQEEAGGNDISSLRLYMMSGDWIPLELPDRIKKINSHSQVISLGGATEGSIWSIYYPIDKINPAWKSIPYGYPLGNQEMYVLDKNLQPAPLNIPGDIYIGGTGVAKGYYKDEVKTAASFIYHPVMKKILYRTGDLGCQHPDGYMIFLGRQDGQVKINGFRVELGEIETILQQSPLVHQCVVITIEDDRRNKRLVAYVVPAATFDKEAILYHLRQHLPEYMVPSLLMEITKVPLSANGKVDKNALPVADVAAFANLDYIAPGNETEARLAAIWEALLKIERPGIHDDFFELGGNSLVVIQLVHKINTTFKNANIQLIDVMRNNTIAKQCAVISCKQQAGQSLAGAGTHIITLRDGDHQEVTFIVPGGLGATEAYLDMAKNVPGTGAVYGLQMKGVSGNDTPSHSIGEMAAHNLTLMSTISTTGKVNLWGHSYAGIVIYEMLKQAAGAIVTGEVVLLDCYTDPLSFSEDPAIVKLGFYFKGLIRFSGLSVSEKEVEQLVAEINHRSVEEGLQFIYDTVNVLPKEMIGRMWEVFNASASAKYSMNGKLNNRITVIQADNSQLTGGDWGNGEDLGWNKFFEEVTVIHTAGNHFSLVNEPHCSMWASTLKTKKRN